MSDIEPFSYFKGFVSDGENVFCSLLPKLHELGEVGKRHVYGKTHDIPRKSCLMILRPEDDKPRTQFNKEYKTTPRYQDEDIPSEINTINQLLKTEFNEEFDYVLCHIYRNGHDYVSYHNDKEALKSGIASVSLSNKNTARTFRFRKIGETSGFEHEFALETGDLIYMYGPTQGRPGCQSVYSHSLIKINGKKGELFGPRINLTFRKFE